MQLHVKALGFNPLYCNQSNNQSITSQFFRVINPSAHLKAMTNSASLPHKVGEMNLQLECWGSAGVCCMGCISALVVSLQLGLYAFGQKCAEKSLMSQLNHECICWTEVADVFFLRPLVSGPPFKHALVKILKPAPHLSQMPLSFCSYYFLLGVTHATAKSVSLSRSGSLTDRDPAMRLRWPLAVSNTSLEPNMYTAADA